MDLLSPFTDPATIAHYAQSTPRKVPGFADLQRMAMLLLAEHAPGPADILVLGAGGGMELKAFAEAQPQWRLVGVDPATAMLDLARDVLGARMAEVRLVHGLIDDAPPGPFDGATCLLTLHFLPRAERLRTLQELRLRMAPGAPLVVAHHSAPQGGDVQTWLTRSIAFANRETSDFAQASATAAAMAQHLPVLPAEEDEALLAEAGFSDITLFYAGFSFRGWVAAA